MGRIIGIDLGTTYSCVTIPETRVEEGYHTAKECPGCSVVQDKFKRMTTPSVVAENRQGDIVVGHTAKGLAGSSPEPIMFAKRSMGGDVTFHLDKQGSLKPEEVSAHILRQLKEMAEQRLGEPVDEAVITVPAYFTLKAKQLTEKAGEMAGMKVAQIAQEPVAAALAYCVNDTRDPLTIMTYDLGGGTFDVAVLEKRDGIISSESVKAFDGDRFLGGCNFDERLALWLIDRLQKKGYKLDPKDSVMFAKILVIAERVKTALSKYEYREIDEQHTNIEDQDENPVIIREDITRAEFEAMIEPDIDNTIDICKRALHEKGDTPMTAADIDEIIMVGGSSRIPMVTKKIEEEFEMSPKLINPDLCVALGAGILAGSGKQTIGRLKLDPIPEKTDLPNLTITGNVVPGENLDSVEGLAVSLSAADGSFSGRQVTGATGNFVFDGVILAPEDTTDFSLSVITEEGVNVTEHTFSVEQTEEISGGGLVETVTNILAKPIFVLLADGPHEIAPERVPLPFNQVIRARTMDDSGVIRIVILEEHEPLGEIVMENIPKTLDVGSSVEISLEIQGNYQIIGKAYVPAIDEEKKVIIDIPVPKSKTLEELRAEFNHLREMAIDVKATAGRGELFAKVSRLDKRLAACENMIDDTLPDLLKIQDTLHEIESLVREIGAGWRPEPPRAIFMQKADTIDTKLASLIQQKPEIKNDGYDSQLDAIRKEADDAYGAQNTAAWQVACGKLDTLLNRLGQIEQEVEGGGKENPPPDPAAIIMGLGRELEGLEQYAKDNDRYEENKEEFDSLAGLLKQIDPQAGDAMAKLHDWYFNKYDGLKKKVTADGVPGPDSLGEGLVGLEQ